MAHLKTAAYGGFVLPPESRRPGEAQGRRKIIPIALPDSLVRIRRAFSDQDDLRQIAFLGAASRMESFCESAARIPEDSLAASHDSWRKSFAGGAEDVGHTHEVVTHTEVQSEFPADLPIVFEEQ